MGSSIADEHFSVLPKLKTRVEFWKRVYTHYTTDQAIIHDQNHLDVIYQVVHLPSNLSQRQKDKRIELVKRKYRNILRSLSRKVTVKSSLLTSEEKRLRKLVKGNIYRSSRNIRVQIGQRDRFREGLKRSGRYMKKIREIFQNHNLPLALTVLPHVESSFQLSAYSSAGAAGIWQFTRSTGRRFLKIGYAVDERLDPIFATDAAARLLKFNYQSLHSWPLAITAYNHGLQGMKRAKRRYGDSIEKIIKNYQSRTFGFASQNFYCEFLAALDVVRNKERYFPNLKMELPIKKASVKFGEYMDIQTAMTYFHMNREEIRQYNPALRQPVINGNKRIPKGFTFQIPGRKKNEVRKLYKQIPSIKRFKNQKASKWYRVQRGDTLSEVAMRFRTSVSTLKGLNHIGRRNLIYPGQVLQLPGGKSRSYQLAQANFDSASFSDASNMVYKVRRHDNLSKIARQYRMDPLILAAYNHIQNPDNLYPGQLLKIPQIKQKSKSSIKIVKHTKGLIIKSTQAPIEKKVSGKIGIKLVKAEIPNTIKKRPAFLPVVFDSEGKHPIKIGTISVDFDETLSHYADWAKLSLREIRKINRYRRNQAIHVNDKIKVPFYRVSPEIFEEKREEYHKAIQEDFFNNYQIRKTVVRKIKKGETIWDICNNIYSLPFWLLNMYNPDQDINSLDIDEPIIIPIVIQKNS